MSTDPTTYVLARQQAKLTDLMSKAERLGAMGWDEFKETHPPTKAPANWRSVAGFLGTSVGVVLGGVAALAMMPVLISTLPSAFFFIGMGSMVLGGAAVGAAIGRRFPTETDRRGAQIDAYEGYLKAVPPRERSRSMEHDMSAEQAQPAPDRALPHRSPSPSMSR